MHARALAVSRNQNLQPHWARQRSGAEQAAGRGLGQSSAASKDGRRSRPGASRGCGQAAGRRGESGEPAGGRRLQRAAAVKRAEGQGSTTCSPAGLAVAPTAARQ